MRRERLVLLLLLLMMLVPARDAAAAGFLEWLERLSGPGPFKGLGIDLNFLCYGARTGVPGDPAAAGVTPRWQADLDCRRIDRAQPRISAGVRAALLTGDNNLEYVTPLPRGGETVQVFSLMGTADYGISRTFDIGAGAGFMRFTGAPAGPFARFSLQLVRFTWKPLTMGERSAAESYRREWLQIRYIATLVPGGFDAADFGARPGSFDSGTEFLSSINVVISLR